MKRSKTFVQCILVIGWYCVQLGYAKPSGEQTEVIKIFSHNISAYEQDIMRLSKAAEMRNYMNESVDPCMNFYGFACGNWAKLNPANSIEHITTGLFEAMMKALDRKVELILKSGVETGSTEIDLKVKEFFESCTKVANLRGEYKAKLIAIMREFGEMPALKGEDWNGEDFNWLETVARISHKFGKDIIIGMDILPDYTENTVNRVYIGHPNFPLETKSMYMDNITSIYRLSYRSKIKDELKQFLGLPEKLAHQTAKEILDFEIVLARGMIDEKLGLGLQEMSVLTTIEEMQKAYAPTIDIKRLVNISLGELVTDSVYEFVESYQLNLMKVIKVMPKRIVANYIFYNLLDDFLLKTAKTKAKQEKACVDKTKKYFAKNLDNMIYRKYNTDKTENDVNLIWNEIKSTFKSELRSNKLDWITKETREYAIEKLDAMKLEINSYANDNFTEEFGELLINSDDYVENVKNILELGSKQAIAELHQPPKPLEAGELLSYTPANIILENKIKVPVSLLQPYYLWAANYPNALKFGTLGTLVGHELIHGFDDSGRTFDKDGNNYDWWDTKSTDAFVERTQCFSEQYSHYLYGGRFLPKSTSQSENIADNAGVRLAYAAYLKWYEEAVRSGQDLHLESFPTMQYTSKQLFFISYGQVWCNDVHPRVRDLQTSTDEHVPGKFRVIGPLSNFAEFAKEFKCAAGTRMNPIKKCKIY